MHEYYGKFSWDKTVDPISRKHRSIWLDASMGRDGIFQGSKARLTHYGVEDLGHVPRLGPSPHQLRLDYHHLQRQKRKRRGVSGKVELREGGREGSVSFVGSVPLLM